jgi:hypothetical protein
LSELLYPENSFPIHLQNCDEVEESLELVGMTCNFVSTSTRLIDKTYREFYRGINVSIGGRGYGGGQLSLQKRFIDVYKEWISENMFTNIGMAGYGFGQEGTLLLLTLPSIKIEAIEIDAFIVELINIKANEIFNNSTSDFLLRFKLSVACLSQHLFEKNTDCIITTALVGPFFFSLMARNAICSGVKKILTPLQNIVDCDPISTKYKAHTKLKSVFIGGGSGGNGTSLEMHTIHVSEINEVELDEFILNSYCKMIIDYAHINFNIIHSNSVNTNIKYPFDTDFTEEGNLNRYLTKSKFHYKIIGDSIGLARDEAIQILKCQFGSKIVEDVLKDEKRLSSYNQKLGYFILIDLIDKKRFPQHFNEIPILKRNKNLSPAEKICCYDKPPAEPLINFEKFLNRDFPVENKFITFHQSSAENHILSSSNPEKDNIILKMRCFTQISLHALKEFTLVMGFEEGGDKVNIIYIDLAPSKEFSKHIIKLVMQFFNHVSTVVKSVKMDLLSFWRDEMYFRNDKVEKFFNNCFVYKKQPSHCLYKNSIYYLDAVEFTWNFKLCFSELYCYVDKNKSFNSIEDCKRQLNIEVADKTICIVGMVFVENNSSLKGMLLRDFFRIQPMISTAKKIYTVSKCDDSLANSKDGEKYSHLKMLLNPRNCGFIKFWKELDIILLDWFLGYSVYVGERFNIHGILKTIHPELNINCEVWLSSNLLLTTDLDTGIEELSNLFEIEEVHEVLRNPLYLSTIVANDTLIAKQIGDIKGHEQHLYNGTSQRPSFIKLVVKKNQLNKKQKR